MQQFLFEITSFLTLKVACGRNLAEEDWNKETNRPISSRWHVGNALAGSKMSSLLNLIRLLKALNWPFRVVHEPELTTVVCNKEKCMRNKDGERRK